MAACSSRVVPRVEVFFLACSCFVILSDKSSFAGHIGQLATIELEVKSLGDRQTAIFITSASGKR